MSPRLLLLAENGIRHHVLSQNLLAIVRKYEISYINLIAFKLYK